MPPLISICIPTYNGEDYLRECLDSVLPQTFADFEVLIVDDRSTDHTLQIAQSYAQQDSRIKVVQNSQNLGLVGNWNRCAELAQGEWIKYVFQDDLIAPRCLEKMLAEVQENTTLVCCRRDFIFSPNTAEKIKRFYQNIISLHDRFPNGANLSVEDFGQVILSDIGHNFVGEPTTILVRREAFYRFGGFNPHLIQICDLEFCCRIAVHTGITYVPETLATFRLHQKSTSSKNHDERQYRVEVIDPLLLLHDFVFHPLYAPLRAIATQHSPSNPLAATLAQRAYRAKRRAQEQPNCLPIWTETVELYPILPHLAKFNLMRDLSDYGRQTTRTLKHKVKTVLFPQPAVQAFEK
ncbi:MAG: glycosyltransferase [Oculatellaceae cyanobacterium Prado106]|jgi:glycosyltransferase involved in cell wall biosynthesis|nr:glycosyltransferase [Oculatellaceae cyanobacterium Prado106]